MSWSINLSGPKSLVHAELRNAVIQIQQALETLTQTDSADVAVNVGGHASVNTAGAFSISSSHAVTAIAPPAIADGRLTVMEMPIPEAAPRYEPEPPAAS